MLFTSYENRFERYEIENSIIESYEKVTFLRRFQFEHLRVGNNEITTGHRIFVWANGDFRGGIQILVKVVRDTETCHFFRSLALWGGGGEVSLRGV